jgi:hypothetical protein
MTGSGVNQGTNPIPQVGGSLRHKIAIGELAQQSISLHINFQFTSRLVVVNGPGAHHEGPSLHGNTSEDGLNLIHQVVDGGIALSRKQ